MQKEFLDNKTLEIIKNFVEKFNFILDLHTAIAVEASKSIKKNMKFYSRYCVHPWQILDTNL